jgi:hypothetical protein
MLDLGQMTSNSAAQVIAKIFEFIGTLHEDRCESKSDDTLIISYGYFLDPPWINAWQTEVLDGLASREQAFADKFCRDPETFKEFIKPHLAKVKEHLRGQKYSIKDEFGNSHRCKSIINKCFIIQGFKIEFLISHRVNYFKGNRRIKAETITARKEITLK